MFDLAIFNKQTYTAVTETLSQQVNVFNRASNGAITLLPAANQGNFAIEAMFKSISGLVKRRDINGSDAVDPVRLEQLQNASVKIAASTAPVEFNPSMYTWIQQNPELAVAMLGEQIARETAGDMLNVAIKGAVAAATGQGASAVYGDGTAAASFSLLNSGAALFGDRSGSLVAWVLHSKIMHDLFENGLTNAEKLFTYENVNVIRDPFGRLFVVTDSPDLVDTTGVDPIYKTLGLQSGAVNVQSNGDFDATLVSVTGGENIKRVYQAEWTMNLGIKGYTWDIANGGASPSDVALATATNWDKTATSIKDTAGVLILSK